MSYKFKVGDKGKTRCGEDYEVICVVDPEKLHKSSYRNVVVLIDGYLSSRREDGSFCDGMDDEVLIPPPRTVYVNFYDSHRSGEAYHYETEDEARKSADNEGALAVAVRVELPNS